MFSLATALYNRKQLDDVLEILQDGGVNWKSRPKVFMKSLNGNWDNSGIEETSLNGDLENSEIGENR